MTRGAGTGPGKGNNKLSKQADMTDQTQFNGPRTQGQQMAQATPDQQRGAPDWRRLDFAADCLCLRSDNAASAAPQQG